nr:DUF5017 domain-containing protein [Sphingobacterium chuzhouense]
MKTFNKYSILLLLTCMACTDEELDIPVFDVQIDTENALKVEDGIPVFEVGSSIMFNIQGTADMVTFFSGEPGMMYEHRDRTKIDGIPFLQFQTQMENGDMPPGFFHVLLSSDFEGFSKDRTTDAERIRNATWEDITEQCDIPLTQTTQLSPKIDLSSYGNNPLYVAFRYDRPANRDWPRYQVRAFRVGNDADGITYDVMRTGNAGWTAFDFNAREDEDPYLATGGSRPNRIWDFRNAASDDRISIGYDSDLASDDWAITAPIALTSISPDLGLGIKAYNDDWLRNYQFIYNNPGTFTVSFVATNSAYANTKIVVKEMEIKIIE